MVGQKLECFHALLGEHAQPFCADLPSILKTQQLCTLHEVLDLSTIEIELWQLFQVRVADVKLLASHVVEEVFPDLLASLGGEIIVRQEQINSRLKSVINTRNAVGGKKQDPLVVLKLGEEDCRWLAISICGSGLFYTLTRNEFVPREAVICPGTKEYVCFV